MTKRDLINAISKTTKLSKDDVLQVINAYSEQIGISLIDDNDPKTAGYEIQGIGTLKKRWVAERTGRNPKTGETIVLKPHATVKFSLAKKLKDKLNIK